MKLRQIVVSLAAVSALAAAAPSFAQSDIGSYPPAPPPESLAPFNGPNTGTVIVAPGTTYSTQPGTTYSTTTPDARSQGYVTNGSGTIVTPQGGMTPQERRDTAGTHDRATGVVTAPGYMGPHDAKGQ